MLQSGGQVQTDAALTWPILPVNFLPIDLPLASRRPCTLVELPPLTLDATR